jgi:hypothetical protein
MSSELSFTGCKKRLGLLWFTSAGVIFAFVLAQSLLGRYGGDLSDAWSWLLPNLMPTLSLIVGVFVADMQKGIVEKTVDAFVFRLAIGLSVVYFLTILITLLAIPLSDQHGMQPIDLLNTSNLWLAPLQGLAAAALGAFFVKGES